MTDFGGSPEFASMNGEPISRERPHGVAGGVAVAAAFNPANAPRLRALGAVQVLNVWWEGGFEPRRAEGWRRDAQRASRVSRFVIAGHIGWPSGLQAKKRFFGEAGVSRPSNTC